MKRFSVSAVFLGIVMFLAAAGAAAHEASVDVYFVAPKDGATVGQDVHVVMGVDGMQVQPAGKAVEGAGHHHLIVDGGPVPAGQVVPKDATHHHFGKGQTETTLHLAPGDHTLTLQFANGLHQSYGPAMSRTITVHVK